MKKAIVYSLVKDGVTWRGDPIPFVFGTVDRTRALIQFEQGIRDHSFPGTTTILF